MQKLLVGVGLIIVVMVAFIVGTGWYRGQSKPKDLKLGQAASVRLRGVLLETTNNSESISFTQYYLSGNNWRIPVDMSALSLEEVGKAPSYVGKTVIVSGNQKREVFIGRTQLADSPPVVETDVLFATSLTSVN